MDVIKHSEWADTKFTLHLLSQILGKIKLETAEQEPQWAHVTLAVTPNGFVVPSGSGVSSRLGYLRKPNLH